MSVLIGDVGSTSADWAMIGPSQTLYHTTSGFNATSHPDEGLKAIEAELVKQYGTRVSNIYYYGAGVNSEGSRARVRRLLGGLTEDSRIDVESDLLGAMRAVCGDNSGLVAILGTGSNVAVFDGQKVGKASVNLGYLLADEGSGFAIGRSLVKAYLYGSMPTALATSFDKLMTSDRGDFLSALYGDSMPNRYLANFASFAIEHKQHSWIRRLVTAEFQEFIDVHVLKFESSLKIYFVGSIAFYFCDELREVVEAADYEVGEIVRRPIELLAEYHRERYYE